MGQGDLSKNDGEQMPAKAAIPYHTTRIPESMQADAAASKAAVLLNSHKKSAIAQELMDAQFSFSSG